jgi:hypothetical protein
MEPLVAFLLEAISEKHYDGLAQEIEWRDRYFRGLMESMVRVQAANAAFIKQSTIHK